MAGSSLRLVSAQQQRRGSGLDAIDDVRSIIAQSLKIPVERLEPDTRLDELGAESLDVIEIVFALEEKFDISIPFKADEGTRVTVPGKDGREEMEFATVGDVATIVQKLVAAKNKAS
jgi:acyl carrier protein